MKKIVTILLVLTLFCSCKHSTPSSEQEKITEIADKVWTFSQSHPDGFTLDIHTFTEPKVGIAVSYAATQDSHSREMLDNLVKHSLDHDGYVGGCYNDDDNLYYFDSTRLFPEDSLESALKFGKENGQIAVFVLSTSTSIPIDYGQ